MLHITNGDCAAEVLSRAVSGTILPWRDVLHEGPVRAGLELEELSRERAAFIAQAGWGEEERIVEDFRSRDVAFEAEYLGTMAAERAAELFALRSPVTRRHLREAQAAWAASGLRIRNTSRASSPRRCLSSRRRVPRWLGGYEVKDERVRWDPASGRLAS